MLRVLPIQAVTSCDALERVIFSYIENDWSAIKKFSTICKAWRQHVEEFAKATLLHSAENPRIGPFLKFSSPEKTSIANLEKIYSMLQCFAKTFNIILNPFPNLDPVKNILDPDESHHLLCLAVQHGDKTSVELLLAGTKIWQDCLDSLVSRASRDDYPKIVELLLANREVSQFCRDSEAHIALSKKRWEILMLLEANGPISESVRRLAIFSAISNRQLMVATRLLAGGVITSACCVAVLAFLIEMHISGQWADVRQFFARLENAVTAITFHFFARLDALPTSPYTIRERLAVGISSGVLFGTWLICVTLQEDMGRPLAIRIVRVVSCVQVLVCLGVYILSPSIQPEGPF